MPRVTDYPARGRVLEVDDGTVVFAPRDTTYRLHLRTRGRLEVEPGARVAGLIRAEAKKLWTVPSGGNFIEPIFGPLRVIQGRVMYLDEAEMVLQCGAPIVVALPAEDSAFDLINGPVALRGLINVNLLPGTSFELIRGGD
jgi:hypothetical protein